MVALTAPWSVDAESAIRQTLAVVIAARATHPSWGSPIVLDVVSGTVTFDETWAPHVQAQIVCAMPSSQAVLDLLDPRDLVRIEIDAGYVYPGGVTDVHALVNLGLRTRPVSRPGGTITITAESDEAQVQDAGVSLTGFTTDISTPFPLKDMITTRLPLALGYTPTLDVSACVATPVPVTFNSSIDQWDTFKGACDVGQMWIRDTGLRTWVVGPWSTTAGQSCHLLRTGTNGTIQESSVSLDRAPWANVVYIRYTWTDPVYGELSQFGVAYLTGPRAGLMAPSFPSVALPGIKMYYEERQGAATLAQANAAAAAVLTRRLRAARAATLTARSAFWVRPGRTVAVQLPLGPQELHLVARVSFDLASGQMTVNTRAPDNTPIGLGV